MIEFVCDNQDVKRVLEKLGEALVNNGAWLHPYLQVVWQENNFSMHCTQPIDNGVAVAQVPDICFIEIGSFSFSSKGCKIAIDSANAGASPLSQELMSIVVDLYNASSKLEQFRQDSVYRFYYDAPDLYKSLTKGFYLGTNDYFNIMPRDEVFLRSFLDSRVLHKEIEGKQTGFLIPLIEYFNHSGKAKPAQLFSARGVQGMKVQAHTLPGKSELFINYGSSDPRDLMIGHGFFDPGITVAKSISLEFKMEDKKIIIYQNSEGPPPNEMPDSLTNLVGYCPYFDFSVADTVKFNFLYIPDKLAPRSLRRILFYGINILVKDEDRATRLTQAVEHKIISENFEYYKSLKNQIDQFKPSAETEGFIKSAREMVKLQLSIIENYRSF